MTDRKVYRVEEVAKLLGISRGKAYAMAQSGELPTARFGKSVRIPCERFDQWLEARTRGGRS